MRLDLIIPPKFDELTIFERFVAPLCAGVRSWSTTMQLMRFVGATSSPRSRSAAIFDAPGGRDEGASIAPRVVVWGGRVADRCLGLRVLSRGWRHVLVAGSDCMPVVHVAIDVADGTCYCCWVCAPERLHASVESVHDVCDVALRRFSGAFRDACVLSSAVASTASSDAGRGRVGAAVVGRVSCMVSCRAAKPKV